MAGFGPPFSLLSAGGNRIALAVLPIVQRELQVAARSPRLFQWRLRTALAITAVATLIIVAGPNSSPAGAAFQSLSTVTLLLCLVEGLRKTSDAITTEKREGTLGLLFLSTLSGFDIIMGKMVAALVRSLSTLLAFVPVLSTSLLLGGTTAGEFWRTILVLILALTMSLSLCLLVSTLTRNRSMGAAIATLLFLSIAPLPFGLFFGANAVKWVLPISPWFLLRAASDAYYSAQKMPFWNGVAYLILLIFSSISIASLVLPRSWQDRAIRARGGPKRSGSRFQNLDAQRRAMLDKNPIMWLMFNAHSHQNFRRFLYFAATNVMIGMALVHFGLRQTGLAMRDEFELILPAFALGALILVTSLRAARETSRNLSEARENGALELILSTPIKVREVIQGQWLALRADLRPVLLIGTVLSGLLLLMIATFSGRSLSILYGIKTLTESVVGVFTIGAVGMWMGLTSKSPARAFLKTVLFGLLLPHLVCTPTLVNQLVVFVVAADRVKLNFRRFISERYSPLLPSSLSPVSAPPSAVPPVLR